MTKENVRNPTTTAFAKSTVTHLQFVLQSSSALKASGRGHIDQTHDLYRNTCPVGIPRRFPLVCQCFGETLVVEGHWHATVKTFISCYRTPGPQKGLLKGSLKGFRRVLEGFLVDPF